MFQIIAHLLGSPLTAFEMTFEAGNEFDYGLGVHVYCIFN